MPSCCRREQAEDVPDAGWPDPAGVHVPDAAALRGVTATDHTGNRVAQILQLERRQASHTGNSRTDHTAGNGTRPVIEITVVQSIQVTVVQLVAAPGRS